MPSGDVEPPPWVDIYMSVTNANKYTKGIIPAEIDIVLVVKIRKKNNGLKADNSSLFNALIIILFLPFHISSMSYVWLTLDNFIPCS